MSLEEALEAAAQKIGGADEIAFACHIGPDGDALGSMLGLALAARDQGKKVRASFGSPFEVPPSLRFLPTELLVDPSEFPEAPDLMVVLDVGSADRVGELARSASAAGSVVVIDHHVTNEGFGDIAVVDSDSAATGQLVFHLLRILDWPITAEIAQCLLTALVTDTGRFQYSNTRPETFRIAAELVEAGGDTTVIGRHVYEEAPFGYLKAASLALGRAVLDEDRRMVSAIVRHDDLEAHGIGWAETENLIDLVRLATEADTAVLVKEHEDGRVKVSMRSRGDTDVGGLAHSMGGGGHRLAAGFTSTEDVEKVMAEINQNLERFR